MSQPLTRLRAALLPLGRIWRPFLLRRRVVGAGLACAVAAALFLLALPLLAGRILDAATAGDVGALNRAGALFAAAALCEAVLRYGARRSLIGESRRAEEELKRALERQLVRLPIDRLDRARTGDIVSRLTQDVEALRFTTGPALLYGTQAAIVVPGGIALVVSTSAWLALGAALAFGAMAFAMRRLGPAMQRRSRAVQDALGDVAQHAAESFASIRLVQAAHRLIAEDREIRRRTARHLDEGIALARLQARIDLAIHAAVEVVLLLGLALGATAVVTGGASPGELLRFYALLGIQLAPLLALGFVLGGLPRALGAAERVEELLQAPREPEGGRPPAPGPGRIEVRGLTFEHPDSSEPVLRDVSFTIEPGQTVGFVGAVGCGKSTIIALLLRLHLPPAGTVLLDGQDVLELDPRALRARFAVALQDPFLFDDSVEQNVRFGASAADVSSAVRDAGLEPDLADLPRGLETVVGERGVTLSGGQRQRTALARALAADRPILVLDDTLSAVDQETERWILDGLRRRRAGRTTLIVTHRLSAVEHADRIVYLERGRVVASGPHAELVSRCLPYVEAWRAQRESQALEGGAL